MKKNTKNTNLTFVNSSFKLDENREYNKKECVQEIEISELHAFKNHPFKVQDDEKMIETVESIQHHGVLIPIIARPLSEGGYEIISGHRRHRACKLAGKKTIPAIIRNMDDDEAVLLMVDSNLQRETILPSERAFAYKMKMEAIKHQGKSLTSRQIVGKSEVADIIGEKNSESGRQVQRYIRLTELIPSLLKMVDEKIIAFNPAYELSFLKPKEQKLLIEIMDYEQTTPSLSQAQRIKKLSQEEQLTKESLLTIISEKKKNIQDSVVFTSDVLKQYFPSNYTPKKMEETIIQLLEQWKQNGIK